MNADSVKARLKNAAVKNGWTFQEALTYYGLERTIYRISVSQYSDHFILKGGIFLYAVHGGNFGRATTDIDLLAERMSNDRAEMKVIFQEIFSLPVDDAITFDSDSVKVEDIAELKQYHGVHISVVGFLDRTRIPVGIDIGFGDVIYPDTVRMNYPVILDTPQPRVNAYSLESVVAEKLEAIVRNGYLNSRYKDFYDIYVLSKEYAFEYSKLREAVAETFENRKTFMTMDTAAFSEDFLKDPMHQTRWKSFLKKKKTLIQVDMPDAMSRIKVFALPLLKTVKDIPEKWDPESGKWQ